MKEMIPRPALAALKQLNTAGNEAFLVGGCVRDLLMGREPGDFDITTSATPAQVEAVFAGERIIETGLRHGTVTVLREGLPLEITTYRRDLSYSDHRHPDAVVVVTTNISYEGCRDINQSVLDRMSLARDVELPTPEVMVQRAMSVTGATDE